MKSLIVGRGEIGKSLNAVISKKYETYMIDEGEKCKEDIEIMHICFPYSDKFVEYVEEYMFEYKPKFTVIHSTVPMGTTKKFNNTVVHSPVRGKHPDLSESIETFVKYIGANNKEIGHEVAIYFNNAGVPIENVSGSDNTEVGKILSTTYYGWNILFMQLAHEYCETNGLDFDIVYRKFNETYNEGYAKMSGKTFSKFHRPVLEWFGTGIGGHCVWENAKLSLDNNMEGSLVDVFSLIVAAGKPKKK